MYSVVVEERRGRRMVCFVEVLVDRIEVLVDEVGVLVGRVEVLVVDKNGVLAVGSFVDVVVGGSRRIVVDEELALTVVVGFVVGEIDFPFSE